MFEAGLLNNKTVLVTGGGSGLGLSMAKKFHSLGAAVHICGRNEEKLKKAVNEIGAKTSYTVTDVRDAEAVHAMISELSQLDVLVNNAAGNFLCASEDVSPNAFNSVIDIVLKGSFHCALYAGKRFIEEEKKGVILNIISTYTETGSAFILPSACAKAGVYAMTTSLAYEWAHYGIRVNGIAPGPFPTKGAWKKLIPNNDLEDRYKEQMPLKRFGKPEELADLAVYIIAADYMSGEVVTLDGAERLRGGQFNFLNEMFERNDLKDTFKKMR